jgi:predicted FMN-binding regulatory protein PaiB
MNKWITDRLPTAEESDGDGIVWAMWRDHVVLLHHTEVIDDGQPWQPVTAPTPYVKPKSGWTLEWNELRGFWVLNSNRNKDDDSFVIPHLTQDQAEAAQRIEDIYNKALP